MLQMLTKMQQSHEAGQQRRRTRAQTDSNVLQHWPQENRPAATCDVSPPGPSGALNGELNIGALELSQNSDSGDD